MTLLMELKKDKEIEKFKKKFKFLISKAF